MRRLATAVVAVLALALGLLGGGQPTGASSYPVPYSFLTSAALAGLKPDADPPGANIWTCKPSAAHPRPVVLVHGLIGNKATNWQTYAPLLANNGYCVFALTYGLYPGETVPLSLFGGRTKIESSAVELARFIAKVLAATKAAKVDIVGHSEGTVMPNYYAKFLGGARYINNYISLAPLWHGTNPTGLDTLSRLGSPFGLTPIVHGLVATKCASCPELLASSAFWAKMRSGGTPAVAGIKYTNIVTRYDELVQPYTSGIQTGMTNYVVQNYCAIDYAEHFQIAADPVAAALVLNALDPAHKRAVPCRLVLPFL